MPKHSDRAAESLRHTETCRDIDERRRGQTEMPAPVPPGAEVIETHQPRQQNLGDHASPSSESTEGTETAEGYVVDIACIRSYPRAELVSRAREHTKECALMGHCVESRYGLVDDAGRVTLLDMEATPKVVEAVVRDGRQQGIRLRAERKLQNEKLHTIRIESV